MSAFTFASPAALSERRFSNAAACSTCPRCDVPGRGAPLAGFRRQGCRGPRPGVLSLRAQAGGGESPGVNGNGAAQPGSALRGMAPRQSLSTRTKAPGPAAGMAGDEAGVQTCVVDNQEVVTQFVAETLLPTKHGKFRLRGYRHSADGGETWSEPTAVVKGIVKGQENVPVRVHDACYTSEVLGSLKCDCAEQLELALEYIHNAPPGIVIYLQQEGRGIGLANKIAAYALQEDGLDTVDANRALGLPDDCREYSSVRNMLEDMGVESIQLMTNNPRKVSELTALGVNVTDRMPCIVRPNEVNKGYLEAKEKRMQHELDGSWCYWNHDGEPQTPSSTLPPARPVPQSTDESRAEDN